jgi:multimeric flavodoxin WrbA
VKVTAFCGSARKKGNTYTLINAVCAEIEAAGIETEIIELAGTGLKGCAACMKCFKNKNRRCAVDDDQLNEYIEKIMASDGIILGSPTYFADVSSEMKALIDRAGMVARTNGNLFRRKAGAAVVAVRRAGAIHVFDSMNHFFLIGEMIVAGSSYWNVGRGLKPGEVEQDSEGMQTMRDLGKNMAWLVKKIS